NHENEDSTTPTVIAEVLEKFNGGRAGPCHTLVYFDRYTMSNELLMKLQESMGGAPVMLLDVTKLKFGLITAKRRASSLPKVDLLIKRPEKDTCRVLLSWSRAHFQRSLLVLARFYPEIIRLKDVLILSTEDKNIGKFIPQLKRRIVVRKSVSVARCNSTQVRFVVEQSCTACDDVYMQNIAEWDRDAGMAWKKSGENTMSGVLIKVSYTTSVPNIFNTSKGVLDGLELRMLQYASEALNFTYVLQVPRDGECGRIVNGSWTGKVGDVVYRRADLAIGGIVYRSQTSIFASYSTMFHNELWSIVCPPPSKMPLWLYVMFPFKSGMAPSVFTVLVVFHGFTFAIVMLTFNFEWRAIETETSFTRSVKNVFRVASSFYLKIMVCLYFWNMLFCILEPQYEETISSSLGLLSSTKKYGVVRDTTVESILANSLDASQGELAKNARQFSSSEGQYSVDVHGMCLVGVPELYAKFIIRSQYITRCGEPAVQVSGENLHTVMGEWLMASKSPLKEKFDPIITRLQGFGFLDKWRADLYASLTRHRNERRPCRVQSVGPLSLLDLRLAFFFLITGWMIALVVLLVERVAFNFVRSFNAEFGPTYNEAFSSVSGRSCQPQRKWAHKVLDGVNPNRETSWDYQRNKAKFGYQMYVLLRDITEGDVMRRGSQLLPRR
ncbi:Ionotropic glutamate receptor L-glutamate and glycine-binding domain, partial [Trinorchestia longiramus]